MITLDTDLFKSLLEKVAESPRLRTNLDLRTKSF